MEKERNGMTRGREEREKKRGERVGESFTPPLERFDS